MICVWGELATFRILSSLSDMETAVSIASYLSLGAACHFFTWSEGSNGTSYASVNPSEWQDCMPNPLTWLHPCKHCYCTIYLAHFHTHILFLAAEGWVTQTNRRTVLLAAASILRLRERVRCGVCLWQMQECLCTTVDVPMPGRISL